MKKNNVVDVNVVLLNVFEDNVEVGNLNGEVEFEMVNEKIF